jgi:hypothetical protein
LKFLRSFPSGKLTSSFGTKIFLSFSIGSPLLSCAG